MAENDGANDADQSNPAADADPAAGSRTQLRVFEYALAEKSELYVDIVDALVEAKERFRLQLRPRELRRHLQSKHPDADESGLAVALEQLHTWGNVSRFYDPTSPETLAEFYGRRFLYQLTPEGLAAHAGVRAVRDIGLDAGGRLSSVLLPGIIEKLEALLAEVSDQDPVRLYQLLGDLFGAAAELADNAGKYMSDLAVETSTISKQPDTFHAYKQAVLAYLDRFVAGLSDAVPRIRDLLASLDGDIDGLLVAGAAADAAPRADGTEDSGPVDGFRQRWAGLHDWFIGTVDDDSVADHLRGAMLEAINRILAAVGRLNERHLRRVSRESDFMRLAAWFADEAVDRHDLWDTAFGLFPARHFGDHAGDEAVERRRSFWEAEPAQIPPRLRAAGTRGSPGRPGKLADYSAVKAQRVAAVRRAHAEAAAAVARLAGRTPARIGDLGDLDQTEFAQFLDVVDAALSSPPDRTGARVGTTATFTVTLTAPADGERVNVKTRSGTLNCPNYALRIVVADVARKRRVG